MCRYGSDRCAAACVRISPARLAPPGAVPSTPTTSARLRVFGDSSNSNSTRTGDALSGCPRWMNTPTPRGGTAFPLPAASRRPPRAGARRGVLGRRAPGTFSAAQLFPAARPGRPGGGGVPRPRRSGSRSGVCVCRLARSRALWEIPQGSVVRVGCRACGASERVPGVRQPRPTRPSSKKRNTQSCETPKRP